MAKEMIISFNGFERKIAILDDGQLTEYYIERLSDQSDVMAGNIYKGRVTKVLPGMQSAFIDIGLDRDAFLYVTDVLDSEEIEYEPSRREPKRVASAPAEAPVEEKTPSPEEVSQQEVEELLEAIAQAEEEPKGEERESPLPAGEREYDEQMAELIETITEDLIPESSPASSVGDDAEVDLKDAIIEEKLIGAVHREEVQESEGEHHRPAEGITVGSVPLSFGTGEQLERVVDEPEEASEEASVTEETPPPQDESSASMSSPPSAVEAAEERESEAPERTGAWGAEEAAPEAGPGPSSAGEGESHPEEGRAQQADRSTAAPSGPAAGEPPSAPPAERSEAETDPPLDDAEASLRHRRPRAEFAARRKVRRRRSTRQNAGGDAGGSSSTATTASPTITELLHEGQELLVQIAKEPIGNKGARVTTHIVLPGRFLVYMPTVSHVGVSRRIPSQAERTRLRRLAAKLRSRHKAAGGFIVRTAAEGRTEAELSADMKYLVRTWNDILRRAEKVKAPALLYREVDLVQRILRDRLSQEFTAIRVDSEEEYTRILDFVNHFQPDLVPRVKLYTRDTPIFEQYGVQPEIEKSIRPRVWLKSGGYIVINQTEALVAIDVNTGKFVGKTHSFEDTITRTNIEAAREIARQIRLRDLGGIIVLDFIDMEERKNRQKVMQVLEEELKKDRAPAKILSFNDFGLVAITRKRVRQSLERSLCEPCPYCHGRGMIKSPETVCYEMFDEVRRLASQAEGAKEVVLRVHPVVERALREKYPQVLEAMESYLKGKVNIETDPLLHQERFDIALV